MTLPKLYGLIIACLLLPPCYSQGSDLLCQHGEIYNIGVQGLDYFPHYDFSARHQAGYFVEVIRLFSQDSGCRFEFVPLPIKRLQVEFTQKHYLDFAYPDNPDWHQFTKDTSPRYYSDAITIALGGTMVRAEDQQKPLAKIKTLVAPRGFTPVAWLQLAKDYQFQIVEAVDAMAALHMVQRGRADAADIEFNVAQHLLAKSSDKKALVLATQLPFKYTGFSLSSLHEQTLLQHFNQFLRNNKAKLQQLKQNYGLRETRPSAQ